jgi:uncharacterized integral membrane protein
MRTKVILILIFLILFAIVIIQNNQQVPFRLFFWHFFVPKVILIPVVFIIGFLFGLAVALAGQKPKKQAAPPSAAPF